RGHLGDPRGRRVDADGEQRHDRVALHERAVAAAAGVMAAAYVHELPAFGGRDEELTRVRVRERGPHAVQCIRLVEDGFVAARLPAVRAGAEPELLTFATRDSLVAFTPQREL